MTQAICGVNASCPQPESEVSSDASIGGSGGAAPSTTSGAEGAGNVAKTGEPEASLRCLPEVVMAARDCGKALLVRKLTDALVCGLRLESLRECLTEPSKK
ncbi:MAG: hypothetical protein EOO73_02995 [Myxococcales bacterium]|nr:MAG: hypothetical protein EOO73_02995 [Myxococcales bacterium]